MCQNLDVNLLIDLLWLYLLLLVLKNDGVGNRCYGFVGSSLCKSLEATNFQVRKSVQRLCEKDWSKSLVEVDTVVHTAVRVHVMSDSSINPSEEFKAVNVDRTLNLAHKSIKAGVKRFVYLFQLA